MTKGTSIIIAGQDLGPFLPGRLDLKQAFAIKNVSEMTPLELGQAAGKMDPLALQVIVWFLTCYRYDPASQGYQSTGRSVDMSAINFVYDDVATAPYDDAPAVSETQIPKEMTSDGDATPTSSPSPTSAT